MADFVAPSPSSVIWGLVVINTEPSRLCSSISISRHLWVVTDVNTLRHAGSPPLVPRRLLDLRQNPEITSVGLGRLARLTNLEKLVCVPPCPTDA